VAARRWSSYGNIVIIDHGMGVETRYAHLSKLIAREGDFVAAGTPIGEVGRTGRATGTHLHFEVREHDQPIDPEAAFVDADAPPATIEEAAERVGRTRAGS
jgi:murein DD-endopeptidase MepM/ murein hydrolase activator NlpD